MSNALLNEFEGTPQHLTHKQKDSSKVQNCPWRQKQVLASLSSKLHPPFSPAKKEAVTRQCLRSQAGKGREVDFGSNIGISAAYFLSRDRDSRVYLFEPLPGNIEKLRKNLAPFEGCYTLEEAAVGEADGEVDFDWEQTRRFGGVGIQIGNYIKVKYLDSNRALETVLSAHNRIDILKIDIESLEKQVTERVLLELARQIGKIHTELAPKSNPLEQTHHCVPYGTVAQFLRKEQKAKFN